MPNDNYSVQLTPQSVTGNVTVQMIARTTTTINYVANLRQLLRSLTLLSTLLSHASNALPPRGGTGADGWVDVNTAGVRSGGFNINEPTVTGNT